VAADAEEHGEEVPCELRVPRSNVGADGIHRRAGLGAWICGARVRMRMAWNFPRRVWWEPRFEWRSTAWRGVGDFSIWSSNLLICLGWVQAGGGKISLASGVFEISGATRSVPFLARFSPLVTAHTVRAHKSSGLGSASTNNPTRWNNGATLFFILFEKDDGIWRLQTHYSMMVGLVWGMNSRGTLYMPRFIQLIQIDNTV
jgi:hypothetical protein